MPNSISTMDKSKPPPKCPNCNGDTECDLHSNVVVEFLVAWSDHRWTTATCRLSGANVKSQSAMVEWAVRNLGPKYGENAVLFAVYSIRYAGKPQIGWGRHGLPTARKPKQREALIPALAERI